LPDHVVAVVVTQSRKNDIFCMLKLKIKIPCIAA
jgi:hypothetical protein